jgi:lipopolysaccharide biosynthesis glycosyltransferase
MKTCLSLVFDRGYRDQAAVFIQSLGEQYHGDVEYEIICIIPEEDIEFCLKISEVVSLPNTLKVSYRAPVVPEGLDIAGIKSDHWGTNTSWYRLFVGSTLPEYDKVILFDADMLVVKDIQPLLDFPDFNKFMAAYDVYPEALREGMENMPVFNGGLFIADLNWWRDSKLEDKFVQHIKTKRITIAIDDDVLNRYVKDVWYPLPVTFNFYYFNIGDNGVPDWDSSYLTAQFKGALIIHFFGGGGKPWNYEKRNGRPDVSKLGNEWRNRRNELFK